MKCTFRGLTFGSGTRIHFEDEEIGGLKSIRVDSGSTPAPGFDGAIPGLHRTRAVDIVFPLRVVASAELDSLLADLDAAFQPHPTTSFPLTVERGGEEWLVYGRPIDRREIVDLTLYAAGAVPYRVALERTDPHWYGTTLKSVSVPVYSISGGGFDWPIVDWPIDLNEATQQVAVAVNEGNADAYPLLRIQRPAGSPGTFNGFTVTNDTTGTVFDMDVSISAGQTLFVDFFAYVHASRGVDPIQIDGSSRFTGWQHPRIPLEVAPGSNTFRLEVDGTADDTLALISFRDTSL